MRTLTLYILLFILWLPAQAQELLITQQGSVTFFSAAPLENIQATSKKISGTIHTISKKLNFEIPINSFVFDNSLMQEHFNDKFMESRRYPKATFSGDIINHTDFLKAGVHEVIVKGLLLIHGVEQERTITGTIINKNGQLKLKSSFQVKLEEHNIKVPDLVYEKIAEVIDINLTLDLATPEQIATGKANSKVKNTISQATP